MEASDTHSFLISTRLLLFFFIDLWEKYISNIYHYIIKWYYKYMYKLFSITCASSLLLWSRIHLNRIHFKSYFLQCWVMSILEWTLIIIKLINYKIIIAQNNNCNVFYSASFDKWNERRLPWKTALSWLILVAKLEIENVFWRYTENSDWFVSATKERTSEKRWVEERGIEKEQGCREVCGSKRGWANGEGVGRKGEETKREGWRSCLSRGLFVNQFPVAGSW